jgi:hypothetical protein
MADNAPTPTTDQNPATAIDPATASLSELDAALAAMGDMNDGDAAPAEPTPNDPTPSDPEPTPAEPEPEPDPEPNPEPAPEPGATPTPKGDKPPQYRHRPKDAQEEAVFALLKTGKSLKDSSEAVYGKTPATPAEPAAAPAPVAPIAPKPDEVVAQLKKAEAARDLAMDNGDSEAYARAAAQVAELTTSLPEGDIMRSIGAARKAAKAAEANLDFTAQAQAERDVQKWQQALEAKNAKTREAQARETHQRQTAVTSQVQVSVAKAQELYSFAKEGDGLFGEFEKFVDDAAKSPEYEGVIRNSTNWPVIMADVFAAQKGIARGAKPAAAPTPAPTPAARTAKPAAPGTKATLLTTGNAPSPGEAPSPDVAARQVLEKAMNAKSPKELEAIMAGMSFDAPSGPRAVGF